MILLIIGLQCLNSKERVDKNLRFNSNGEFTILQFTDLHFGEDSEEDAQTQKLQVKLIKQVNPDLVVLTGDMLSGYAWDGKDQEFY